MDVTIHASFLPRTDPEASLRFGLPALLPRPPRLRGPQRRRLRGHALDHRRPARQPEVSIVLEAPASDPGVSDEERAMILEMMAKGTYAGIVLATPDIDALFERMAAGGAQVVQEPIEQDYGVRDCAFRDPAGDMVRVQEQK